MARFRGGATVEELVAGLRSDGYAIVEGVLDAARVASKRAALTGLLAATPAGRNDFEGTATQRVYALFGKTRAFDGEATHPLVMGVLDAVLGQYQLSAPQAIQIGPGESAQPLHRDDQVYPIQRPHGDLVVNTMWAIDDFTAANGATHVVPGSHTWTSDPARSELTTVQATMPAGSLLLFLGGVLHGGGANETERPRLGVILEYVVGWLRQQENQYLVAPPALARTLPPRLQELLGYSMCGLLGVVDARHPGKVLGDG